MNRATELAALVGSEAVEQALSLAATAGRFGDGDLESILDHLRLRGRAVAAAAWSEEELTLQPGTSAWEALG